MKYTLLLYSLLLSSMMFSQEVLLDSLLDKKKYLLFEGELKGLTSSNKDSSQYWYYKGKLDLKKREIRNAFISLKKVDTTQLSQIYKGWYFYILGDAYRYNNQEEKGFFLKLKSKEIFDVINNTEMSNAVNYDLHYTLVSQDFLEYDGQSYLKTFFDNAQEKGNINQLLTAHLSLSFLGLSPSNVKNAVFHLEKARHYANLIGTPEALYKLHNYKAVFYQSYTNDLMKSKMHIDSMIHYANIINSPDRIDSSFKTKAYSYTLQGEYKKAIKELLKAESLPIRENIYNRKKGLYRYLSLNYENLNKKDSAFFYYKKMVAYGDSISISKQNTILTLLETQELSQKNLMLDAERIRHKNRFYLAIGVLLISLILGTLVIMYYRKKKQLAEKDKELKAIDARNEEKDRQRQRIAGELHDNLGGLIVAIKQSFDNLKASKDRLQQEEDNLMFKTKGLLDEAYKKVRNMAHLEESASRNSGYWVDVIKDYASIINESNQLSVEVQSYGTANIIDTSVENDLRRITTELITNAIKHAEALEISVDITANENALTIIVEDNGIGLDKTKLEQKKGLGLYSIMKKVEELKGTFTIDSLPNRGTTFITEIPL
ncbi:ATP-binding protein [uncultured Tenacibaculum sp.]|uniref:sensor histidine kinase n=1 Tax=uncultured Tenacibaculum sp. TaxID=174713 RepID=UPI002638D358|nr:ATP-binding protein [uncultured Tenacibaculum sp.]